MTTELALKEAMLARVRDSLDCTNAESFIPSLVDTIQTQAAQIAELKAALEEIVGHCRNPGYGNPVVNERIVDRCDETASAVLTSVFPTAHQPA